MFQPFAWYTAAPATGDVYLTAVQDDTVFSSGNEIRVPPDRNFHLGGMASYDTAAITAARLETPSLRPLANQSISAINLDTVVVTTTTPMQYNFQSPRELKVAESMQVLVTAGATSANVYAVMWNGDGPQQPVQGNYFTTKLTAAVAQAVGLWKSGEMTFTEFLPVQQYQVVGMRVEAATGVAARLIFSNSQVRPGVPLRVSGTNPQMPEFRYGRSGVFGQFDINQPPRLETLGGTATSQVIYLDLLRTG